jgi:Xaa-Pro aminopeptidase
VDAGTIDLVRSFGVEVVSSADLVSEFEATVSDRQLHSHRVAADRLGQIVQEAFGELTIRVNRGQRTTELDIQKYLVDQFAASGLEADHPPIVAIDAHSADPHYSPTSATASEFKPGQFVLIDAWCKVSGVDTVYADITWTAWLGNDIPDRQRQVFRVVRDARDAAVKYMEETLAAERPLLGCDIDDACRKVIVDAGFGDKFIHRTGHSLHTSVHGNGANLDNLESRDDRRLLPRTLVTIEPGIYLPGEFGVRSEINVYVSENGKARVTGIAPQTGILSLPCV